MAPAVAETPPQDKPGARDKLLHRMVRQLCFLQAAEGRRSARRPVASWVEAGRSHPRSPNGAKDARRSDRRQGGGKAAARAGESATQRDVRIIGRAARPSS